MQALFETYSKNGIIEIPKEYNKFIDKKLKVIIMTEEEDKKETDYIDFLLSNPIKIDDFEPLARESIYE
jgi:hypothetical protein